MPPISIFLNNHPQSPLQLFKDAVTQTSQHLSRCQVDPSTARVLADYFLRPQPEINALPFGVALAHATLLYHLKLHRPSTSDLENIVALLNAVVAVASDAEIGCDPSAPATFFFEEVVRGALLGLPPRSRHVQRRSAQLLTAQPHFVVLLPTPLFDSFSFIACTLACHLRLGALRNEWLSAIAPLSAAPAVLVSLRARLLQMRCSPLTARQHAAEVVQAVAHNAEALPTEAVALIFDHLRLAVNLSEGDRSTEEHALSVAVSAQLLEMQSPVRRKYVESYLYPALRDPRMEQMLSSKTDTAAQMGKQLLRLMSSTSGACPFYLSACALFQRMLRADSPLRGAMFLVSLCQLVMPEGGVFISSLAVDAQMDGEYFAQVIFEIVGALTEAIDFANRPEDDDNNNNNGDALSPVAKLIDRGGTSLFVKVLFMLRLIVSSVVSASPAAFGVDTASNSSGMNSGRSSMMSNGSNVLSIHSRRTGTQQQKQQQQGMRPDALVMDLRTALSRDTIHKIGNFIENVVLPSAVVAEAAESSGMADVSARVLVVEIAMLLHHEFVDETIGRVRDFLTEQLASKTSDAATSPSIVSHMNRVMLALADSPTARKRFATVHCANNWLRHDPLDPVTHVMVLNVMARCPTPATRLELFDTLYPTIISSVLPAVRRNLVGSNNNNNNNNDNDDVHGVEDCAGASSALVLVTRMMLMVRPTGPGSSGSNSAKNQQQQQLAKRLCVDIAMIASALAASNQLSLKNHVAMVLWWASLSLLRFGGEKTSVAVSSASGNDASSACYHLFTALRYVHLSFPKLVGIATARLVMDFCLHAPIIIDNLVSVLDENPQLVVHQQQPRRRRNKSSRRRKNDDDDDDAAGDESLVERYSLALRDDSPFRTWLRKHILRSVPSRTALLIAYAQCIASRVRVHNAPHELLVQSAASSSSSTMLVRERAFSAMLTDTVLASDRQACDVFCKSACAWLRGDACPKMTTPGPFLMVICALLSLREVAPPKSRSKIHDVLQQQVPRVATVAETLRHDSPPFSRFALNIVSVCTGQQAAIPAASQNNNSDINLSPTDPYRQQQQQQQQQMVNNTTFHNDDDDDADNNPFFDDGDDGQIDHHDDDNFQQQALDVSSHHHPAPPLVALPPQTHHQQQQQQKRSSSSSHHSGKENSTSKKLKKNNKSDDENCEFHVDTWQALQRQDCNSLLQDVRDLMRGNWGPRVGGPEAASEDVAQQQHEQISQIQHMVANGSGAGAGAAINSSSASLTPGNNGAWQGLQQNRTALREVQGLLTNTTGSMHGSGMNVSLI